MKMKKDLKLCGLYSSEVFVIAFEDRQERRYGIFQEKIQVFCY